MKDYKIIVSERESIRLADSRLDSLYMDSLMVFFEQGYQNTPIKIKVKDKIVCDKQIETVENLGIAEVQSLGLRKNIDVFQVSINDGKYFSIGIESPIRYVAISYFVDTVYVDYLEYYPFYE